MSDGAALPYYYYYYYYYYFPYCDLPHREDTWKWRWERQIDGIDGDVVVGHQSQIR